MPGELGGGDAGGGGSIPGGGGDPGGGGGGGPQTAEIAGPLVSEELAWKRRAEQAEARVAELESEVSRLESALAEAEAASSGAELKRRIDRELASARAIDLETAALLTEAAVAGLDDPDVAAAVAELRRRKPFLFGRGFGATAMGAIGDGGGADGELADLAEQAKTTGDKRALLRYLRLRRGAI